MPRPKLGAAEGLDEASAVKAAQAWYDGDRRSPSLGRYAMVTPVLGAYRNSAAEWSLMYRVEPDTGTSYLFRYKYNQAGSSWKVASAGEEGACMHADTDERDVPALDEAAAAKAAKRWYDKNFYGGVFTMRVPHINAYCNRARGFPREYSLRYRATGPEVDPAAEHFVKFKYAVERKEGKTSWKWRVVCLDLEGATQDVDPAAALAATAAAPDPKPAAEPATKEKMPKIPKIPKLTKITVGPSSSAPSLLSAPSLSSAATEESAGAPAAAAASPKESKPRAEKKTKLKVGSSTMAAAAAAAAPTAVETKEPQSTAAQKEAPKLAVKNETKSAPKKASKAGAAVAAAAAPVIAVTLDKDSALNAAKTWYEAENKGEEEMVPLKIYRNNDKECTLLYHTEPNETGNTYLRRVRKL